MSSEMAEAESLSHALGRFRKMRPGNCQNGNFKGVVENRSFPANFFDR